ncbi:hypothetical protein M2347_003247 [Chryseobacterium sp. H1D6B]|uniref:hypothetical protein n=1 Tax=Chryseobacterium sp. H1D6B TaxID=2940588 RepID=UPI0015CA2CD0|nr:hypothetical protein [Chryseobacterium sp. H1D6B]MDH6253520.1 hypothetical protein [Chryseobacterium sp. H1D6B]
MEIERIRTEKIKIPVPKKYIYGYLALMAVVGIIFITYFQQKDETRLSIALDFYNTAVHENIKEYVKGSAFKLNGKDFKYSDDFINSGKSFLYFPDHKGESPKVNYDSFDTSYPIDWNELKAPYLMIKPAASDTMVIIQDGKRFLFKRVKYSD